MEPILHTVAYNAYYEKNKDGRAENENVSLIEFY